MFGPGGDRGPLDTMPSMEEREEAMKEYKRIKGMVSRIDSRMLEVEQHIIDMMMKEAGANNIKTFAEALEIVSKFTMRPIMQG